MLGSPGPECVTQLGNVHQVSPMAERIVKSRARLCSACAHAELQGSLGFQGSAGI
jgi:hypothetical protein